MTIEQMTEKLKCMVTPEKLVHSLAVKDAIVRLSQVYGGSPEKAAAAGLVHDCAKSLDNEELLKLAGEFGILVDSIQEREPAILHAPVGAELARIEFGIIDSEILNAIRCHTTGCEGMGLLSRLLYVADYISEDRAFPEVESLRKVSSVNLDAAVIMGMDLSIRHVISKGGLIHPDTISARNSMIQKNPGLDYTKLF